MSRITWKLNIPPRTFENSRSTHIHVRNCACHILHPPFCYTFLLVIVLVIIVSQCLFKQMCASVFLGWFCVCVCLRGVLPNHEVRREKCGLGYIMWAENKHSGPASSRRGPIHKHNQAAELITLFYLIVYSLSPQCGSMSFYFSQIYLFRLGVLDPRNILGHIMTGHRLVTVCIHGDHYFIVLPRDQATSTMT